MVDRMYGMRREFRDFELIKGNDVVFYEMENNMRELNLGKSFCV